MSNLDTDGQPWDVDSFETSFRETRIAILGYLTRRAGNAADAADLLAEVYLTAWRRRDQLPHGEQARLWLFGVARNQLANQRRRAGTQSKLADALQAALELHQDKVVNAGLATAVADAVAELNPTD